MRPGTGTPCSGGITSRELIELVRHIVSELPVKHMDIVEVAPPLDINDITKLGGCENYRGSVFNNRQEA